MGVSGSGKSTIARGLAAELDLRLAEGDDFHAEANTDKMEDGTPLTDDDREPWLDALAAWTAERHREGVGSVLASSALRRRYRDVLRSAIPGEPTYFVHLVGDVELIHARMRNREHFMPVSLLASQVATLEPLADDETGVEIDIAKSVDEVVADAVDWLRARWTRH